MTWSRGCGEERAYVCECVGSWLCHSARMCQSVLHVPVGGEREESVKPSARSSGGGHRVVVIIGMTHLHVSTPPATLAHKSLARGVQAHKRAR
jgi:hypothetical protein